MQEASEVPSKVQWGPGLKELKGKEHSEEHARMGRNQLRAISKVDAMENEALALPVTQRDLPPYGLHPGPGKAYHHPAGPL